MCFDCVVVIFSFISGGKDSCYNMMQCVQQGHVIVALANLKPRDGGMWPGDGGGGGERGGVGMATFGINHFTPDVSFSQQFLVFICFLTSAIGCTNTIIYHTL